MIGKRWRELGKGRKGRLGGKRKGKTDDKRKEVRGSQEEGREGEKTKSPSETIFPLGPIFETIRGL